MTVGEQPGLQALTEETAARDVPVLAIGWITGVSHKSYLVPQPDCNHLRYTEATAVADRRKGGMAAKTSSKE
jgi:hypothetical protein